jgi:hypothetical protein
VPSSLLLATVLPSGEKSITRGLGNLPSRWFSGVFGASGQVSV